MEIGNTLRMIDTSFLSEIKQNDYDETTQQNDEHHPNLAEVLNGIPNDRESIIAHMLLAGFSDAAIAKHMTGNFYKNKDEISVTRLKLNGNLVKI